MKASKLSTLSSPSYSSVINFIHTIAALFPHRAEICRDQRSVQEISNKEHLFKVHAHSTKQCVST